MIVILRRQLLMLLVMVVLVYVIEMVVTSFFKFGLFLVVVEIVVFVLLAVCVGLYLWRDLCMRVELYECELEYERVVFKRRLAHELRAPLQVVRGYNDLNLVLSSSSYAAGIRRELVYIDGVLELLQGSGRLSLSVFEVGCFFKEVFGVYGDIYLSFGQVDLLVVRSDKNILREVLIILIDNANRYGLDCLEVYVEGDCLRCCNLKNMRSSGTKVGLEFLVGLVELLGISCEIVDTYVYFEVVLDFGEIKKT